MGVESQIKPNILAMQMWEQMNTPQVMEFVGLLAASFADKDFDRALLEKAQEIMESE